MKPRCGEDNNAAGRVRRWSFSLLRQALTTENGTFPGLFARNSVSRSLSRLREAFLEGERFRSDRSGDATNGNAPVRTLCATFPLLTGVSRGKWNAGDGERGGEGGEK